LNDPIVSLRIARGKRPVVTEPGIVDQEIDIDLVFLEPSNQLVNLPFVAKIDNAQVNAQLRITISELIAQFIQSLLASRDEYERSRSRRQVPHKFAPDSSRSTGN
jgi:hypothetical protein